MITCFTFDDVSPAYLTMSEFKRLIDFLNDIHIKCTLFIVPNGYVGSSVKEEFVSCLKTALDHGHELALHGYMHTKNEFGCFYPIPLPIPFPTFNKQKERLQKGMRKLMSLTGIRPLGFRAPFYLHNYLTLRALASLGFRYDSSSTIFKPAHGMRLRIRWLRDCRPFVTEGVIELPVSGDYTYNLANSDFRCLLGRAMSDFQWTVSHGGIFVLNNHAHHFRESEYRFLKLLIEKLSEKTVFLRLVDVICRYNHKIRSEKGGAQKNYKG